MPESNDFLYKVPPARQHEVLKVLGNRTRVAILSLIKTTPMSVSEIARTLGVSQPTATTYINQLEEAGLVSHRMQRFPTGYQKVCYTIYDGIEFSWQEEAADLTEEYAVDMPVGHYCHIECQGPSYLATQARIIASHEDTSKFLNPSRMEAELLVLGSGRVRYLFPFNMPDDKALIAIDLSLEVARAFPQSGGAAELTVTVNGHRFRPMELGNDPRHDDQNLAMAWFPDGLASSGRLMTWTLDNEGAFCNGDPAGEFKLRDIPLSPLQPIEIEFAVQSTGTDQGGAILMGKNFGRHNQDIRLTITYEKHGDGK